jgi:hypothetical protein
MMLVVFAIMWLACRAEAQTPAATVNVGQRLLYEVPLEINPCKLGNDGRFASRRPHRLLVGGCFRQERQYSSNRSHHRNEQE